MDEGTLPFRYGARLANEIELHWQDRWERDGTFHAANPDGPLAAGFDQVAERPKSYLAAATQLRPPQALSGLAETTAGSSGPIATSVDSPRCQR